MARVETTSRSFHLFSPPRHVIDSLRTNGRKRRKRGFTAPVVETLEDRQLLSTITVTNTNDDLNTGSLRWAITQADAASGAETIDFDPNVFAAPQTINLASQLPDLSNTSGLITVDGPAAGVTVEGPNAALSGALVAVDANVHATLSNLTIAGGNATLGGGVLNQGTLSLTDCTLSGNSGYYGGGIDNASAASLMVSGCLFTSNTSYLGGAIRNDGTVTILNSTFSDNTAGFDGGGIDNRGTATVTGCTFDSNSATKNIGGAVDSVGSISLINCTLTGNSAAVSGGGFDNYSGPATLTDCTISGNSASEGGGVYNGRTLTLTGTIVAGNSASTGREIDGSYGGNHDLVGENAMLAPLGDYGGPTQTMALLPHSPALGMGVAVSGVTTDQRGFSRGAVVDIGAFQASGYLGQGPVINTAADGAGPGQLTLRQALNLANTWAGAETITFDPTVFASSQTITLGSALPALADTTGTETVTGPAAGVAIAHAATNSAQFGILVIDVGVTAAFSNLTITGGSVDGGSGAGDGGLGGGIKNRGTATLTDCTLSGNSAEEGGGIGNEGSLNLTDCTLSGNSAESGGGIWNPGVLTLADCTLSGNSAESGGGVYNGGTLTLTGTIVAGNSASTGREIDGSYDGNHDLVGENAMLAPLGDYGGPTQTMALLPHSPALGMGVAVSGVTTDQRGFSRGAVVDIGAFQASGYLGQGPVINTAADGAGPGQLTLRQALNLANTWAGAETITFDPTVFASSQTITLGSALPALADTTGTETVTGPAAGVAIAHAATNSAQFGILVIDVGVTAAFSNLTITGGRVDGGSGAGDGGLGGGIKNRGTATLTDCTLSGNSAEGGGGIGNEGSLNLTDCTLSGNSAESGGGIWNDGMVTLTGCTLSGNSALDGGAIFNDSTDSATLTDCTLSGNSAEGGGGICNDGMVTLTDCTISGNSASKGGGVYNDVTDTLAGTIVVGNVTLTDCTISGNSASEGGGVYNSGTATLTDTIVAGNSTSTAPDIVGTYIENNDLVGGNAMLAPLGDYGGPTQTMALLTGSPALGAGVAVSGVTTDQRGFSRGATVDIGAFQATGHDDPSVVNTWLDTPGPGLLTVREAINLGTAGATNSITFDPTTFAIPRTLLLASPLPVIPDGLSIDGRSAERIVGTPNVVLDGLVDSTLADGLILTASSTTIAGLQIDNFNVGILIETPGAFANVITQNLIVDNAVGVEIEEGASSNIVGGTGAGAGNVISGNGTGIVITDAGTTSNLVAGNLIGGDETNPVAAGNTGDGIDIANGATHNQIGASGAGNSISFNQGAGVNVDGTSVDNLVRFNRFTGNTLPPIVDAAGAFSNPPVLSASSLASAINGTVAGSPGQTDTIDFYASPVGDASAGPQARDYLGSIRVVTDTSGQATFTFDFTPIAGEPVITATAIDVNGSTSEFSAPIDSVLFATGVSITASVGIPFQGTVAQFAADPGATVADFTAMINYGDDTGTFLGTVLTAPGGFIVTGSHIFKSANPAQPVTVTITEAGGLDQATASSVASVTSPGGLLTTFGQSAEFVAGTVYSRVVAGFTDSNPQAFPGQFTALIDWGDDSANSVGVVSASGAGFEVTGSHTYNVASTASVPIAVVITDSLTGLPVTVNSSATVDPVPITIQTRNFAVTGKQMFSGTVATFTDGDPRINPAFYTASINWGDGTANNSPGVITGTNPFTVTASHLFGVFQNTDLVTITITDENGRTAVGVDRLVDPPDLSVPSQTTTTTPTTTPTLAMPPAVLAIAARSLTLVANTTFLGTVATFTDNGPAQQTSAYKALIEWGKGRRVAGMITGSNGQFIVSARHKFPKFSGAKTVTVTVSDTEGQTVSVSESASYANRHRKMSEATRPVKIVEKPHR